MDSEKYWEELNVGVKVVHMACALCQKVQKGLLSNTFDDDQVKSKDDDSLVTIAGTFSFSCFWVLLNAFVFYNFLI